jgi:peptidoglycan/LPS O-acetylase OafA/YrhL
MPPPDATAPDRLAALDAARVIATFGIVSVHVAEAQGQSLAHAALGRFGTSFYIIVAALFVVRSAERETRTFSSEFKRRSSRLLRPFLIWSLVYGLYYGVLGRSLGYSWSGLTQWWGPVAGTAVHLWFLPFIFFWGLVAFLLTPRLRVLSATTLLFWGALVSIGLYWFCYRRLHFAVSRPLLWKYHLHRLDRWIVEIPPFFAAFFGALVFHRLSEARRKWITDNALWLGALGLLLFIVTEYLYAQNVWAIKQATSTEGRFMGNFAALFLLVALLSARNTWLVERLSRQGRYTYVAFLCHMLFIELIRNRASALPGYGTAWFAWVTTMLLFLTSLGLSHVVASSKALRFLRG